MTLSFEEGMNAAVVTLGISGQNVTVPVGWMAWCAYLTV